MLFVRCLAHWTHMLSWQFLWNSCVITAYGISDRCGKVIWKEHTHSIDTKNCLTFIGPCIVIYFYSKTNQMHQFLKFILFCSSALHVSDGLSIQHQESKTVHTASGDDGWKDRPKHVECCYKINLRNWCNSVLL